MDEWAAFVAARLDEDEAAAQKAASGDGRFGGRPHWSALGHGMVADAEDPDWAVVDLGPCIDDGDLAGHIIRHDPARALREVEAGRLLIAEYEKYDEGRGYQNGLEFAIRRLAAIWSGHPGYPGR